MYRSPVENITDETKPAQIATLCLDESWIIRNLRQKYNASDQNVNGALKTSSKYAMPDQVEQGWTIRDLEQNETFQPATSLEHPMIL